MFCSDEGACVRFGAQRSWDATRKSVHVLPPVQAGRALPRAHSITCFTGFNSRMNKVTKRKDKSMCTRRDAIAQRSSPGLASNRATAPGSGVNRRIRHQRFSQAADIRRRGCVPATRLKRKERRTGFRQSRCDRSTILARVDRHGRCRESVPR